LGENRCDRSSDGVKSWLESQPMPQVASIRERLGWSIQEQGCRRGASVGGLQGRNAVMNQPVTPDSRDRLTRVEAQARLA
jgi:hypothetical protein